MGGRHEVDHHQHVHDPATREAFRVRVRAGGWTVEVGGERDVWHHGQYVRHRQPHQHDVRGRTHVLAHQDGDVEEVGEDAEDADDDAGVAVHFLEPQVEGDEVVEQVSGVHLHLSSSSSFPVLIPGDSLVSGQCLQRQPFRIHGERA